MNNYIAAFNLMGLIQITGMPNFYKIPNISSNKFRLITLSHKIVLLTPTKEKTYYIDLLDELNIGMKKTILSIYVLMSRIINEEKFK